MKEKAWVWFKGGLNGGSWVADFVASEEQEGVFTIERPDYKTCKVPSWRISFEEPKNLKEGPTIPNNAKWKYI